MEGWMDGWMEQGMKVIEGTEFPQVVVGGCSSSSDTITDVFPRVFLFVLDT